MAAPLPVNFNYHVSSEFPVLLKISLPKILFLGSSAVMDNAYCHSSVLQPITRYSHHKIVNEFVKKITVHAPDKSSSHRRQKIQIIGNFIGELE